VVRKRDLDGPEDAPEVPAEDTEATDVLDHDGEVVSAWAYYVNWSGGVDLIARVARAASWALRDERSRRPICRIDVHVLGDCESFDSPEDFRTNVTTQALHRFDCIVMDFQEGSLRVKVRFGRTRPPEKTPKAPLKDRLRRAWERRPEDWPPRGVIVTVSESADAGQSDQAKRVRTRIGAALERGRRGASPGVTRRLGKRTA
jgi:hypothetical protein